MEDWQEWQMRADQIAAALREEAATLEAEFLSEGSDPTFRAFWPQFRALKEKIRIAPAIRLEDKLDLERRVRAMGSKAYKAQEATYSQSGERKGEIVPVIQQVRASAEQEETPRGLRSVRRELDTIRKQFDSDNGLVPSDRQAVWEAWREANQFVWQKLNARWEANEAFLRQVLDDAREQLDKGNGNGTRQTVARFFEALRTHESKQESMNRLKAEAEGLRRDADHIVERRVEQRAASQQQAQPASPVEAWRSEFERNRENISRLEEDIEGLEHQVRESSSILDQAMLRGTLVEKRRKLSELERSNRTLSQRIEQAEETPLISAG